MVNLVQYPQQPLLLLLHRREGGPTREVAGGGTGLSAVVLPPGEAGILFPGQGGSFTLPTPLRFVCLPCSFCGYRPFPGLNCPSKE